MFGMNLKDFAGWAGLLVVAVIAFLLGFAPLIVEKKIANWPALVWVAFALTVMSLICFGIERKESSKADKQRDQKELTRDARIQKIGEQQQTFSEIQRQSIEEARKLYDAIRKMTSESPTLAAAIAKDALEKGLTGLVQLPGSGSISLGPIWDFVRDWLKETWKWRSPAKKRQTIEDMRKVADSLMLSAFGVPDAELDLPGQAKRPSAG